MQLKYETQKQLNEAENEEENEIANENENENENEIESASANTNENNVDEEKFAMKTDESDVEENDEEYEEIPEGVEYNGEGDIPEGLPKILREIAQDIDFSNDPEFVSFYKDQNLLNKESEPESDYEDAANFPSSINELGYYENRSTLDKILLYHSVDAIPGGISKSNKPVDIGELFLKPTPGSTTDLIDDDADHFLDAVNFIKAKENVNFDNLPLNHPDGSPHVENRNRVIEMIEELDEDQELAEIPFRKFSIFDFHPGSVQQKFVIEFIKENPDFEDCFDETWYIFDQNYLFYLHKHIPNLYLEIADNYKALQTNFGQIINDLGPKYWYEFTSKAINKQIKEFETAPIPGHPSKIDTPLWEEIRREAEIKDQDFVDLLSTAGNTEVKKWYDGVNSVRSNARNTINDLYNSLSKKE